jgi:(heptosyl)LPS beta-1,4-glucosyltransferase
VKLTVTVITRNEAADIEGALQSVAWADEVVVVDSNSTDDTVAIAARCGARVDVHPWTGYSAQRNHAAEIASHDWILALDADERVPPALAEEIRTLLTNGPTAGGYRIPRVSFYLGRWIRGTDWYPDYQLRLYDRRVGRFNGRRVHESVELSTGKPGTLRNDLQHHPYRDVSDHVLSIDRYTTLAAEEWYGQGRRIGVINIALHLPAAFLRNYILRGGFRDGAAGFLISILNSYYVFLKTLKLWELHHGYRTVTDGALAIATRSHAVERTPTVPADDPPAPQATVPGSRTR